MLVRPLLVLGLLLATACGGGNAGAAPGTPAPVPTAIEVTSNHAVPVDVYVTGRGLNRRLGTVHPGMASRFVIPQSALVNGGVLEIEVRSAAGPVFRSGDLLLSPGALVELVVAARIFASTANVRAP